MSKSGRILILDDQAQWRATLCGILQGIGYSVDVVSTAEEAADHLAQNFYHIAILDIRLKHSDPSNTEGMDLLKKIVSSKAIGATHIIMLSAFGTKPQMQEAFSQYEVADFLTKVKFNKANFINRIDEIFSTKVKANLNLNIDWQSSNAREAVINLKLLNNTRVKDGSKLQELLAAELDDLLRRLFYQAETLLVKPMTPGKSGANVLWVKPFYPRVGGAAPMIVKFGELSAIEAESANFDRYVLPFMEGGRHTSIVSVKYIARLGGIVYKLLGTTGETLENFADYYKRCTSAEVKEVLDKLFFETCHSWYRNPGNEHLLSLTEHYLNRMGISKAKLEGYLGGLKVTQSSTKTFSFKALKGDRVFLNPIGFIGFLAEKDIKIATYECIVHGDLNAGNILIDKERNAWLIDFGATGIGHILRDFAELDAIVRFDLLNGEEATLDERLYLEETLSKAQSFHELESLKSEFQMDNPHVKKALDTIIHLQTLSTQFLPNKNADISEYHTALFFYALNSIRFLSLSTVQRQHALMCASLLAEQFKQRGSYGLA